MLSVHHLNKSYGIQTVLHDIQFNISAGDKIGLVGPNGCGKTTLMRILAGLESADSGNVSRTFPGLRVGYLAQGFELPLDATIRSTLNLSAVDEAALEAEIASLAGALTASPADSALQARYDSALAKLSSLDIHPESVLAPLGLSGLDPETPVGQLSGGQKTRLLLARLLLAEPQLLLLDEPTNHLDIAMLEWLEAWVRRFKGAVLVVSHDRAFLDNTVNAVFEIDLQTHRLKAYPGNYSDYATQKESEREKQMQTWHDQQAEIRRMKADISRTKEQAAHTERAASSIRIGGPDYKIKGFKSYQQGIAKKVAAKAKSREKKLERFLESDELVERPRADWQVKLQFGAPGHQSREIFSAQSLSIGYTPEAPLLENLDLYIGPGQKIVLTGENGSGKTTLLRTIAGKLPPLGGTLKLGTAVKLGYMTQEQESLPPGQTPLESLQAVAPFNETEARNFLHFLLFSGDGPLRPNHSLSYGERARLQLGLLIAQGCNFLLLDEPINHLDIASRSRFEQALRQFEGAVLAVVHDRYFIERFAETVWLANGKTGSILIS